MILLPWRDTLRRLPQVLAGLIVFGMGIAVMVRADLGLAPWDVFHQGVSDRTGIPIGLVIMGTGVIVVLGFIPLRERVGLGTLLNAIVIGLSADATLAVVGDFEGLPLRIFAMVAGPPVIAMGSAAYIGGGLGPGPRDGLMTGLARRGLAVWKARTGIEITVLAIGLVLGGTAGLGTLWFAASIGPGIQLMLPWFTVDSAATDTDDDATATDSDDTDDAR